MSDRTIDDVKEEIADLIKRIKTERDELNVQMHLAKSEARDEWARLEKQWDHFQRKAAVVGDAAAAASKDVGAATQILGEELRKGYQQIREVIAKDV